MTIDMDKARAELPILQDFIDFVNNQVGVDTDCLSGFQGNTVRVHRQVARVLRPSGRQIKDGQAVVIYASVEARHLDRATRTADEVIGRRRRGWRPRLRQTNAAVDG